LEPGGSGERDLVFAVISGVSLPEENKTIQSHFYNLEKDVDYYTKIRKKAKVKNFKPYAVENALRMNQ
jgi:hypothetical protein